MHKYKGVHKFREKVTALVISVALENLQSLHILWKYTNNKHVYCKSLHHFAKQPQKYQYLILEIIFFYNIGVLLKGQLKL